MKISDPGNIDPHSITNIIFDWGGVLVHIDPNATISAFRKLGIENFRSYYNYGIQNEFFTRFEIGKVSSDQLRQYIRDALNSNVTDDAIDNAWCAMVLDIPQPYIETLLRLRSKYRLILLSNTNQIHEDLILPRLKRDVGRDFLSLFDRYYFSHHLGMRKPDREIFEYVLRDSGAKAEETLFIDDTEVNTDVAAELGIRSYYLQPGSDISVLFRKW